MTAWAALPAVNAYNSGGKNRMVFICTLLITERLWHSGGERAAQRGRCPFSTAASKFQVCYFVLTRFDAARPSKLANEEPVAGCPLFQLRLLARIFSVLGPLIIRTTEHKDTAGAPRDARR